MSTSLHTQPRLKTKGFTLIELMIVVAIIGILAGVAYPSYTAYIRRGNMQEAIANLSDYRVQLEQYYQDNKAYGPTAGTSCAANASTTYTPTDHKYFSYTCETSGSGQSYVITATGNTGTNTAGYTYTLDQAGNKRTTSFESAEVALDCWAVKSTSDCS